VGDGRQPAVARIDDHGDAGLGKVEDRARRDSVRCIHGVTILCPGQGGANSGA
jgi:hypothetical protein